MPRLRDDPGALASPYLRDHADNPVDWWAWGDDALTEARRTDRPILLSVGYAACHWCHVMAHESFEDPEIARQINASFVAVKVDREERPDVDATYMAATQLLAGHGGWPMTVFLLPSGEPFYAGTYFPPTDRQGLVGLPRLLDALAEAWSSRRDEVEAQAKSLGDAMARELAFVEHLAPAGDGLDLRAARAALRDEMVARVDGDGGFGGAPKFPRSDYVEALLEFDDAPTRAALARTLDAMSRRGLYDHVGGGFARYSVDARWRVPHFEKMLYDQALLARAYLAADRARGGGTPWRAVALDALDFVERDLRVGDAYAASLDADAGGVEGAHVTWTLAEVGEALAAAGLERDLAAALARWRVGEDDLDGRSVPRLGDAEPFLTPDALAPALDALRRARARRPAPALDDKVVLEWNAMLASALLAARDPGRTARALALLDALRLSHRGPDGWRRTGTARATAADLAWLADACLDAFEATGDDRWRDAARDAADALLADHWDGEVPTASRPDLGAGVVTPSRRVTDLAARPKEVFDGATPSPHSVATRALARLALVDADADRLAVARRLVDLAAPLIIGHPAAVPALLGAAGLANEGVEVVVPGGGPLYEHARARYLPRAVVVAGAGASPLLAGREAGVAYVCRGGVCDAPAREVPELDERLAR